MTDKEQTAQAAPPNNDIFPTQGKLMALDVGLARIGIALCDPLRLAARPHSTLTRTSRNEDFARLAKIAHDEEVQGVVCGLPLNMDGSEGTQVQTTRKWAMRLAHALRALLGARLPIILWDERLSSYSARDLIEQWPRHGEDARAAAVILHSYLSAQKRGEASGEMIQIPPRISPRTMQAPGIESDSAQGEIKNNDTATDNASDDASKDDVEMMRSKR